MDKVVMKAVVCTATCSLCKGAGFSAFAKFKLPKAGEVRVCENCVKEMSQAQTQAKVVR